MVTSIARQSVILKCNMQKSVLTGNYEFYYAAGLAAKLWGIEIEDDILPEALLELLLDKKEELRAGDERENYLRTMLTEYRPEETYDEQMRELLRWGKEEASPWSVVIPSA